MWFRHSRRIANTILSGPDCLIPRARLWSRPLRIHLAVNDYCNIQCPHCLRHTPSVPINRGSLGIADLRRLAPWFRSAQTVALAGLGEPFIQKDLFDVIAFIQSHGAAVSVITNGTLLGEEAASRLVGDKLLLLNLSLDAGTPEIFEKVRLGAKFDQVVANVDRLVALKRERGAVFPVLVINMTLMRDTLDEIEAALDLARRWGAPVVTAQTVMFLEDTPDRSQAVTGAEAREAIARARPHAEHAGIELRYIPLAISLDSTTPEEPPKGKEPKTKTPGQGTRWFCPNLWTQMWVDTTGEIMYCCMANHVFQKQFGALGTIRDHDPAALWNHDKVVALRRSHLEGHPPAACAQCHALQPFDRRQIFRSWMNEFRNLGKIL